ncbi:unnamed protein product [Amoebophrya sp. A25]|nr:unnamed protein product [Amoebophrya sp. A25]|eukprot:GSA25T00025240001.1
MTIFRNRWMLQGFIGLLFRDPVVEAVYPSPTAGVVEKRTTTSASQDLVSLAKTLASPSHSPDDYAFKGPHKAEYLLGLLPEQQGSFRFLVEGDGVGEGRDGDVGFIAARDDGQQDEEEQVHAQSHLPVHGHDKIDMDHQDLFHALHRLQSKKLPGRFAALPPRWSYFLEHPVEQTLEEIANRKSKPLLQTLRQRVREASLGLSATCSLFQAAAAAEQVVTVALGVEADTIFEADNVARDTVDEYVPALSSRTFVLVTQYVLGKNKELRDYVNGLESSGAPEGKQLKRDFFDFYRTRLTEYVESWVDEIYYLLHSWSSVQGRFNWFATLIQFEEGRRLVRAMSLLQRSLNKEFFCKRLEHTAVGFQGEWTQVELPQVNMLYWAIFGPDQQMQEMGERTRRSRSSTTDNKELEGVSATLRSSTDENYKEAPQVQVGVAALVDQLLYGAERKTNPFFHKVRRELADFETRVVGGGENEQNYEKFAFLTVLWENSPKIYIDAVRTLAHSCYRLHKGRYRFLVIVPAETVVKTPADDRGGGAEEEEVDHAGSERQTRSSSSTSTTRINLELVDYLLREPRMNLEVYPVTAEQVAPPNWGQKSQASWDWFTERKVARSAIGFFQFAMTEFEKLVYLDADTLLIEPIDELFTMPKQTPFAVAVNLMARFSFGGLVRGKNPGQIRPRWFPFINIACMVIQPDRGFFDHMMEIMASQELDTDELSNFFEKGIHQPWLDHYLMKYSVRAGFALWRNEEEEEKLVIEGGRGEVEGVGGLGDVGLLGDVVRGQEDDVDGRGQKYDGVAEHQVLLEGQDHGVVGVNAGGDTTTFEPISGLSFAGCELDFHADFHLSEFLKSNRTTAEGPQKERFLRGFPRSLPGWETFARKDQLEEKKTVNRWVEYEWRDAGTTTSSQDLPKNRPKDYSHSDDNQPAALATNNRMRKVHHHCLLDHSYNFQVEVKTAMQVLDQAVEPWVHLGAWARRHEGGEAGADVASAATSGGNDEEQESREPTVGAGVEVEDTVSESAGEGVSKNPSTSTSSASSFDFEDAEFEQPIDVAADNDKQVRELQLAQDLFFRRKRGRRRLFFGDRKSSSDRVAMARDFLGEDLKKDYWEAKTPRERLSSMLQLSQIEQLQDWAARQADLGPAFEERLLERVRQLYRLQRINVRIRGGTSISTGSREQVTSTSSRSTRKTSISMTPKVVNGTTRNIRPKILHWAGENRKPWERIHPGSRTEFDRLWWLEYESMMRKSGLAPVTCEDPI